MVSASVDTKQLRVHAYELASTGPIAMTGIHAVTKLATQRIQSQARGIVGGSRHWWALAGHITTETDRGTTEVKGEVGYARPPGGQGKLAHLAEYGSSKSGPLRPHLGPALDLNEEPWVQALVAAAVAPLGKGIGRMGGVKR